MKAKPAIQMRSERKANKGKSHHEDLTPWADLGEDEKRTFLTAYLSGHSWSTRAKHAFLRADPNKTTFAGLLAVLEQFAQNIELKAEREGQVPPPETPNVMNEIRAALRTGPQTKPPPLIVGETVLRHDLLKFIATRDWRMLQWLANYVKEHQHKPFTPPPLGNDAQLKTAPTLHGFIMDAFMRLSGSKISSLLYMADPEPCRLPTKRFLRAEVMKNWDGADLAETGKTGFYKALSELGLGGLPDGKRGRRPVSRREAARARRRFFGG